ncbi:MAG: hypothetical protein AB9835_01710 [Eubacteriales bacterium]
MIDNPSFHHMLRTGISIETPELYSEGYRHFQNFMEDRGWIFNKQPNGDEFSNTYIIHNKNPDYVHREWDIDLGEYQSRNLRNLLIEIYKKKQILNKDANAVPMCDYCELSDQCYLGCEHRKPSLTHPEWSHISVPWIGKEYQKNRIAVLGMNPNEDGGLDQLDILINAAVRELLHGRMKINFGYVFDSGDRKGQKYADSLLWHRIPAYVKALKAGLVCFDGDLCVESSMMDTKNFTPQLVADEYDSLAFINHVKCSPLGDRSAPTNKMWELCGKHILLEELRIL